MSLERKRFREIFEEDTETECLKLLVSVKVKDTVFPTGTTFASPQGLGGIDFHTFRYLDVAVEKEGEVYEIKGFFAKE